MDPHARDRLYVEQPANVKSPGVAIQARRVLAFEVRAEGAAHDCGVVPACFQVNFSPLVADAVADAGGLFPRLGDTAVGFERSHLWYDSLSTASTGGEVLWI